jgi:hypothetical protein
MLSIMANASEIDNGSNVNSTILIVTNPSISSSPATLCGGASTLTMFASPTNASYTYQWSFSTTETGTYTNIAGATASSFVTNATNNVGYYKVSINDGTTPALSPAFRVKQGAIATMVSASPTTVALGASSTLNLTFTGTGPYYYHLEENNGAVSKLYSSTTSPATLSVTPNNSTYYSLSNFSDTQGGGCTTGNASVAVNPLPSLSLSTTPSTLNYCGGNVVSIPVIYNGTWGIASDVRLTAYLTPAAGGAALSNSYQNDLNGSSPKYVIPPGTPNGTYKINLYGSYPFSATVTSSYNITVSTSGCGLNKPVINGRTVGCLVALTAYPNGSGYTYQWYKDGTLIPGATTANYYPSSSAQSGDYTVSVINTTLGFNGLSDAKTIIVYNQVRTLTSNGTNACSPVTITANHTGAGYTYQWYRRENASLSATAMSGETNSSLTVSTPGVYNVSVWDGNCQVTSNQHTISPCPPNVTSTNPVICGSNTQAVLQATTNTAGVYQWSSSSSLSGTYTNISGATSSSYTATTTGYYKVSNDVGTLSNPFWVSNTPYAILLNPSGNTNSMNIVAGSTAAITYNLMGVAPFSFSSNDGVNNKIINSPTNQITLIHTPPSSRYFFANNVVSAGCTASGSHQNSMLVNVGTPPTLSLSNVAGSICAGDMLSVPYTLTGTFDSNISMNAAIYDASTNAYVTFVGSSSTNPLQFQIPSTLAPGTYKLNIAGNVPAVNGSFTNNFTVTAACTPTAQASIQGLSNACLVGLSAFPTGTGYTYQWSRNGIVITGATSAFYNATQSGSYVVTVTNASNGYNSTSTAKTITVNSTVPVITSSNPALCGTNTSVTLNTALSGVGYTYVWQKNNLGVYTTVATTQSLTITQASQVGQYRVIVNDGNCDNISQNFTVAAGTVARLFNSSNNQNAVNLNPGQTETLQLQMYGQSPFTYTFNGQNYTSNSGTVSLPAVSPSISTNYFVSTVLSASGSGCGTSPISSNSILVNVSPNPSFTIGAIPTTACAGASMQVPLTLTGNWGTAGNERFNVDLYTSVGTFVTNLGDVSATPLMITIPSNLTVGTSYKLILTARTPFVPLSQNSTDFTFVATCPPPINATTTLQGNACNYPTLTAFPNGSGYVYQWKKDGVNIAGATGQSYLAKVSGDYTVNIQNAGLSYNSTSPIRNLVVTFAEPVVTATNQILCGVNSTTLSTNFTGAGYTYEWRYSLTPSVATTVLPGETGTSITTNKAGRYYVRVNTGNCIINSDLSFYVSNGGVGNLTNSSDNNDKVVLNAPTTTENLKVALTGIGPWEVGLNDGTTTKLYTTSSSPLIIPVSPTSITRYSIASVSNACGASVGGGNTGSVVVEPAPEASFTFSTPANLTVCRGNSITIPYSLTSTLGAKTTLNVLLADATGGSSRGVYSLTTIVLEPAQPSGSFNLFIPENIPIGSYSLLLSGNGIPTDFFTSYAINVVNTGCAATPAPTIQSVASACGSITLYSSIYSGFQGTGSATYQWFKNGTALTGKTSASLTIYESGSYTVQIINGTYNQTSTAKTVTINRVIPPITSTVTELCGITTSIALSTNFTGAGYTYQWYKDQTFTDGTVAQIPIFGQNTASYTAMSAGGYSVKVFDGSCLHNSASGAVDGTGSLLAGSSYSITTCTTCNAMVSTKSGNWNDITVWSCGRLPLATDPVQIAPTHTVTLNANGVVKSLDVRGILQKQTGFTLQVQGN